MRNELLAKCPLCEGSQTIYVGRPQISSYAANLIKANYAVRKCTVCQFYFVFPGIPFSNKEWETLYADEYFGQMTKRYSLIREEYRNSSIDKLVKCSNRQIKNFLDIGCGEGFVLLDALKRGWNTYGVDICDNRIGTARDKAIYFIKGNIFQAHFPEDYFDCIYMDSVLEHILNPIAFLSEIRRILNKGGVLFLCVPNENSLVNDLKRVVYPLMGKYDISARIKPFQNPFHVIGFTKKSLRIALETTGLEVVSFRNFAGEYQWKKYQIFTRPFFLEMCCLPVHLLAIPLHKRIYLEAIVRK